MILTPVSPAERVAVGLPLEKQRREGDPPSLCSPRGAGTAARGPFCSSGKSNGERNRGTHEAEGGGTKGSQRAGPERPARGPNYKRSDVFAIIAESLLN